MRSALAFALSLVVFAAGVGAQGLAGKPTPQTPKMPESKDKRAGTVVNQVQKDAKKKADPKAQEQMDALQKKMPDPLANKSRAPSSDKASSVKPDYRK
jgi:hypothetical protein